MGIKMRVKACFVLEHLLKLVNGRPSFSGERVTVHGPKLLGPHFSCLDHQTEKELGKNFSQLTVTLENQNLQN